MAVSDVGGKIAFPHSTLHYGGNVFVFDQILAVVRRERVDGIVVGLPLDMDGQETEESGRVREFAQELGKKTSIPVEFQNEMFSSRIAEDAGVAKEHVDQASAALVLQSHLDKIERSKSK